MAEEKKIARLADVGELEADLKKDLAEEEAKGKAADILFCESIEDELSDLENLPTVDPESLRGHAKWVKSAEKVVIVTDGPDDCHKEPAIVCSNCDDTMSQPEFDMWVWNYCPVCGYMMGDATNEREKADLCEKDLCAWWLQLDNCCSVWWIAGTLDDIEKKMKR